MSTTKHMTRQTPRWMCNRWATPIFCLVAGLVFFVAAWIGGHPVAGLSSMAIIWLFGAGLLAVSRRSETVAGLLDRRDERITRIDLVATAVTGVVLVLAIIIATIVEIARGNSGEPFTWLGALGGVSYIVTVIVMRIRG